MSMNIIPVKLFCIFFMYFFGNSYAGSDDCYESSDGKYYLCENADWNHSCGYAPGYGWIDCYPNCGVLWVSKSVGCHIDCSKISAAPIESGRKVYSLIQPNQKKDQPCIYGKKSKFWQ